MTVSLILIPIPQLSLTSLNHSEAQPPLLMCVWDMLLKTGAGYVNGDQNGERGVHLILCETTVTIETPNVKYKADQRAKLYIGFCQTPREPYM